jgi:hypothetical protein
MRTECRRSFRMRAGPPETRLGASVRAGRALFRVPDVSARIASAIGAVTREQGQPDAHRAACGARDWQRNFRGVYGVH